MSWETVLGDGRSGQVHAVAFSPDAKQLAFSSFDVVRIWNVATNTILHVLEGHSNSVRALAYSPDGKLLASGSEDETI